MAKKKRFKPRSAYHAEVCKMFDVLLPESIEDFLRQRDLFNPRGMTKDEMYEAIFENRKTLENFVGYLVMQMAYLTVSNETQEASNSAHKNRVIH